MEVKVAELTVNMERNLNEDIAAKFSQMSEQLQSMNQTQIDSSITMNTKLQAQADGIKQHQASMTAATIGTALAVHGSLTGTLAKDKFQQSPAGQAALDYWKQSSS